MLPVLLIVCVCVCVCVSVSVSVCGFSVKNAMRATVETHEASFTLPPVKVRVSLGSEDLTIKVHRYLGNLRGDCSSVHRGWADVTGQRLLGPVVLYVFLLLFFIYLFFL